ncbi:MAG TPA: efflux transporter periplasmic adaptor subunit [Microscillaceae bacterium]|jgi:membrane fusion protein (multidrug efflux system)|nr:efflux transporter periplasmic adaptor subunit [Microscillaceae bacterium]
MKKTTRNVIIATITLLVLSLALWSKLSQWGVAGKNETQKENKETKKAPPPTEIRAKVIEYAVLDDNITATGTLLANEEVSVRSELSGKVTGIFFREGDYVAKGALMVSMQNEDLKARLRKLEYTKQLNEAKEYRQRSLLQKEAISQQEYDIALTELNTINAEIELLGIEIEKTNIKAPFDGIVGFRNVSVGSYLTPSVEIAKLTNTNPIKLQFAVPAKYINVVQNGALVQFQTDNSEQNFQGTVYAIEPKVDEATRTVVIRALCPNPARSLVPGAFAKVNLILNRSDKSLLLPTEAILPELNTNKVFVVRQGKAELVEVTLGKRTESDVEVLKGIQVGDTVITAGILKVRSGAPVKIQSFEK